MKRLFSLLALLVVLGAGCVAAPSDTMTDFVLPEIEEPWYLTVDGEEDAWYPLKWYWDPSVVFGEPAERTTAVRENRFILQNTPNEIRLENVAHNPEAPDEEGEDWIALDIIAFPERADIPNDAVMKTIGSWEVGVRVPESKTAGYVLYFIETGDLLFQIQPWLGDNRTLEDAEEVIGRLKLQ